MRYLITGGAGFVGSHLCDHLLAAQHEVAVVDDLSTGSMTNIAHLRENPQFNFFFGSLHDRPLMAELVDGAEIVVHLAAAVGVKLIVKSPVRTIETNVAGTETLLALAAKKGRKVIIASTSEVYGKSSKPAFDENDDLVLGPTARGRWSYACSKALDEFLGIAYSRERGTPVVIVRLFNTVGPRQTGHYGMVLPRFVRQALANEPITIYGDGDQRRCFSWVGDVVGAIAQLSPHPGAVGKVFNIGSDEEHTINDLAAIVREVTGSQSELVHIPYDQVYGDEFEDMRRRVPSLARIRDLVDFRITKNLREIVEQVVRHETAAGNGCTRTHQRWRTSRAPRPDSSARQEIRRRLGWRHT